MYLHRHKLAATLNSKCNPCNSIIPADIAWILQWPKAFSFEFSFLFTEENILHNSTGDFDGNKHICQDSSRRLYALLDNSAEK